MGLSSSDPDRRCRSGWRSSAAHGAAGSGCRGWPKGPCRQSNRRRPAPNVRFAWVIILEASLSFLGAGVPARRRSGSSLSEPASRRVVPDGMGGEQRSGGAQRQRHHHYQAGVRNRKNRSVNGGVQRGCLDVSKPRVIAAEHLCNLSGQYSDRTSALCLGGKG
jgi:hypothetical protein